MKTCKTERQWYEIKDASGSSADIWIYEEIGENFWGEGLTAKQFVEDLAALQVEDRFDAVGPQAERAAEPPAGGKTQEYLVSAGHGPFRGRRCGPF